jgi:hypothetical protein
MDGIPAPYSPLTPPEAAEASRAVVQRLLDHEWFERGGGGDGSGGGASSLWAEDMLFYGPSGVGFASSRAEYERHVLGAVRRGLGRRAFRLEVLSCEGAFCGGHGYLDATHAGCLLGEAATGTRLSLRVALHWHVVDGVATEGYLMIDAPALFSQLGIDLLGRAAAPPPCAPEPSAAAADEAALAAAAPVALTAATAQAEEAAFSNDCLLAGSEALQPPTKDAPTTFLSECPAWVVRTTDAVWRPGLDAASVNASLEEFFYEGWQSVSSFGKARPPSISPDLPRLSISSFGGGAPSPPSRPRRDLPAARPRPPARCPCPLARSRCTRAWRRSRSWCGARSAPSPTSASTSPTSSARATTSTATRPRCRMCSPAPTPARAPLAPRPGERSRTTGSRCVLSRRWAQPCP